MIASPPTARFEDRYPPDRYLTEAEQTARRERNGRTATACEAFTPTICRRCSKKKPMRHDKATILRRDRIGGNFRCRDQRASAEKNERFSQTDPTRGTE